MSAPRPATRTSRHFRSLGSFLRRPAVQLGIALWMLGMVIAVVWLLQPFWELASHFEDRTLRQPSRLYGRPVILAAGEPRDSGILAGHLESLGYRVAVGPGLRPGELRATPDQLVVHLRRYPTPQGWGGGGVLDARFAGGRLAAMRYENAEVPRILLEPPLLATYYGPGLEERRPVAIDDLPDDVVRAVLAAEDARFFHHPGISVVGILRAAVANLRGGGIRQGGSTLTQQLVKNIYLSQERSYVRKAREAVLALMLEARYGKREILAAYLNEIFWGRSGPVNLIGIGAASRAYFGKDPAALDLPEAALLAGMIQAPAANSPVAHPEKAKQRRDWVLQRLEELGWVTPQRAAAARATAVVVSPEPPNARRAPYFADAVLAEARERWGVTDVRDAGLALFGTVDAVDQRRAEAAVETGLTALDGEKGKLQSCLLSLEPRSGEILAYVGGRSYARSQFDRCAQARRQAGSAFKPVVLAAAFEDGVALPASLLEDAPLTVEYASQRWSPQNDDDTFRGWVTVRQAVAGSLNVPMARLGLQEGLPKVVRTAHALGVEAPLQPYPALALGAFVLPPRELAAVYGTLASGGVHSEPHGLVGILDATGKPLPGRPIEATRVVSPVTAYLVTSVLQSVVRNGTGAGAARFGLSDPLAGKTGTSNERRDCWFAGYAPERVSLAWVGYDDNHPTRLSGARAALPIWSRFMAAVRPPRGYSDFKRPKGVATAVVDPDTGELATSWCPRAATEVFPADRMPTQPCHLHAGGVVPGEPSVYASTGGAVPPDVAAAQEGSAAPAGPEQAAIDRGEETQPSREAERPSKFRRWLRRVFGSGGGGGQ